MVPLYRSNPCVSFQFIAPILLYRSTLYRSSLLLQSCCIVPLCIVPFYLNEWLNRQHRKTPKDLPTSYTRGSRTHAVSREHEGRCGRFFSPPPFFLSCLTFLTYNLPLIVPAPTGTSNPTSRPFPALPDTTRTRFAPSVAVDSGMGVHFSARWDLELGKRMTTPNCGLRSPLLSPYTKPNPARPYTVKAARRKTPRRRTDQRRHPPEPKLTDSTPTDSWRPLASKHTNEDSNHNQAYRIQTNEPTRFSFFFPLFFTPPLSVFTSLGRTSHTKITQKEEKENKTSDHARAPNHRG